MILTSNTNFPVWLAQVDDIINKNNSLFVMSLSSRVDSTWKIYHKGDKYQTMQQWNLLRSIRHALFLNKTLSRYFLQDL